MEEEVKGEGPPKHFPFHSDSQAMTGLVESVPTTHHTTWNLNTAAGSGWLTVKRCWSLYLRGLVARHPTHLVKVREVLQGPVKPPVVFLKIYRRFTPFDPTSDSQQAAGAMAFIEQSASDIRRKLQWLDLNEGTE